MDEITEKNPEKCQKSLEIQTSEKLKLSSSELTFQEANNKVAALLDERPSVEEVEKLGEVDIGQSEIDRILNKMAEMKRSTDKSETKMNNLSKELQDLKHKRSYEKDKLKLKEIETKISKKQSEFNNAKIDYQNKKNKYDSYAKMLRDRRHGF